LYLILVKLERCRN